MMDGCVANLRDKGNPLSGCAKGCGDALFVGSTEIGEMMRAMDCAEMMLFRRRSLAVLVAILFGVDPKKRKGGYSESPPDQAKRVVKHAQRMMMLLNCRQ